MQPFVAEVPVPSARDREDEDARVVDAHLRWQLEEYRAEQRLTLASIEVEIAVDDAYVGRLGRSSV